MCWDSRIMIGLIRLDCRVDCTLIRLACTSSGLVARIAFSHHDHRHDYDAENHKACTNDQSFSTG